MALRIGPTGSLAAFACTRSFPPLNFQLVIRLHLSSSNITLGDMDAKGLLAVFIQPGPSLDEDKYASILNILKPLDLHRQA